MEQKNHHTTDQQGNKVFHININFILSTYRVLISFSDDKFQLDLRGTEFGELIGFEKKLITKQNMEQNFLTSQIRLMY